MAIYTEPPQYQQQNVPVLVLSIGLENIPTRKVKTHIKRVIALIEEFSSVEDIDMIVIPDFTSIGNSYELREILVDVPLED